MKRLTSMLLATLILLSPFAAKAESMIGSLQEITAFNQVNRYKHPDFDRSADILSRPMLNIDRQVVGEVHNVILNQEGLVSSIDVDFNRLRLRQTVPINFAEMNIDAVSNSYILGLEDEQIKDLYPIFLANINTASGDDMDVRSIKNIVGTKLIAKDGRPLGEVNDVLFRKDGDEAKALYITMGYKRTRGETLTIPYERASFAEYKKRPVMMVDNDYADAILEYLK